MGKARTPNRSLDEVKQFFDHSMILLEMAGDLLTNGHLWKSIDFGQNFCNFSYSVAASGRAESGPLPLPIDQESSPANRHCKRLPCIGFD